MTQTTHAAPAASDPRIDRRIPTASSSMMAWRVHEYGPPNVMKFERIPRPDPGPGEVLVKVEAAGVGPWDGWIRAGGVFAFQKADDGSAGYSSPPTTFGEPKIQADISTIPRSLSKSPV